MAHVLETALRRGYPVMMGPGWIMPDVPLMAAVQLGYPIALFIHVKTDDFAQNPAVLRWHRLHNCSLRLSLRPYFNFC
jgi:hypothetical protein